MKRIGCCFITLFLITSLSGRFHPHPARAADAPAVTVGLASILTGDLSVLGKNATQTLETSQKHYQTWPMNFVVEDARLNSREGLEAYQKLIHVHRADIILAACTSNGTMAAKGVIQASKTPTLSISTGGQNIDQAGPWLFRIGNSDTLNGRDQAKHFLEHGIQRVALLAEQTEYTQDIADAFREHFLARGGDIVFEKHFLPHTRDFRSLITALRQKAPTAIFIPTQTGTALGVFLKQLHALGFSPRPEIHTTFVAAPNPEAHTVAGDLIKGVAYMAPTYAAKSHGFQEFQRLFLEDHGEPPAVAFHAAGIIDSLLLLEKFLVQNKTFEREAFRSFLLHNVANHCGLLGCYSFDEHGNTQLARTSHQLRRETR